MTGVLGAGAILVFFGTVVGVYVVLRRKKAQYWVLQELRRELRLRVRGRPSQKIHLMFALVDHFEPGNGAVDRMTQAARVEEWLRQYPVLAGRHRDADGVVPQHTFFFPPHYDVENHLERIVSLCAKGYGEVEMHLHHDRQDPWPDDEESLERKVRECLESFARYGVFCLPDGRRRFAFIHGDWALANSLAGGAHCGVNDEISLLARCGCFADFTFPVCNEAQPRAVNTLFYGASESSRGKGYDRLCREAAVGNRQREGLLFVQGVMGFRWRSRTHRLRPSIEQSNLDKMDFPFPARIDYWVRKGIHVRNKPDWVFVKVHTHGAREVDWPILLGERAHEMYAYLEDTYNDGQRFSLHYVSAREMYNIVRAAEDGCSGDPVDFRDYEIPRYVYLPPRECSGRRTAGGSTEQG